MRTFILITGLSAAWLVSGAAVANSLVSRAAPDNTVLVTATDYCLVVPKDAHTEIGASERPGGTTVYCSKPTDPSQGQMPANFWRSVEFSNKPGKNGGRVAQLTGCIRPETLDRLDPADYGGQYDSSGGWDGHGNPVDSACVGYKHYVELIEPAGPRACIKCCDDPDDCPLQFDTRGCSVAIPGNYFDCDYPH